MNLQQNVGYVTANGHVHQLASIMGTGSGPWIHTDLTAAATPTPPAAVELPFGLTSWADPDVQNVGYLSSDGDVWDLASGFVIPSSPWSSIDVTSGLAPAYVNGGGLTGWEAQNWMFVVYLSSDGHLHAVSAHKEQPVFIWVHTDLMDAVPGIPLAGLNQPLASWADLTSWHVVYLDDQQALHHLVSAIGGGAWGIDDFVPGPGTTDADIASPLTSWWDRSSLHVAFLRGRHVLELAYPVIGGSWTLTDLTDASGAPEPVLYGPLTSCADQDYQHVVYVDGTGGLHELSAAIGTQAWEHTPITAAGAPPVPVGTGELGSYAETALTSWVDQELRHVVYETLDGNLQHLYAPVGSSTAWEYSPIMATGAPPAQQGSPLTSWVQPSAPANLAVTIQPRPVLGEVANYIFSVTDAADGSPVLGALVMLNNGPHGGGPWQLTGANGETEFQDLRLETIYLGVVDRHAITAPPSVTVNAIGFNTYSKEF